MEVGGRTGDVIYTGMLVLDVEFGEGEHTLFGFGLGGDVGDDYAVLASVTALLEVE